MTSIPLEFRGKPVSLWTVPDSRFTVLHLHDHRERIPTDEDELVRGLAHRRLNVVAPRGGPSWWADRICPAFDAELTAERFALELIADPTAPIPQRPTAAAGGEAAIRMGFRYPSRLPVVAGWDCAFDFHDWYGRGTSLDELFERREQARQHTAVLQVRQNDFPSHIWFGCPADSEWFRGNDRLHEKLNAVGVPHEFVVADACPIDAMCDFLLKGLEVRSRRLL